MKQNGDFEGEEGGEPTDRHTYAQWSGVVRRGRGEGERRGREERERGEEEGELIPCELLPGSRRIYLEYFVIGVCGWCACVVGMCGWCACGFCGTLSRFD